MKEYPDLSRLLAQKSRRRQQLASLTFEEKIAIVNKWRRLTRKIQQTRPHISNQKSGKK